MFGDQVVQGDDDPTLRPRTHVFVTGEDDVNRLASFGRQHEGVLIRAPFFVVLDQLQHNIYAVGFLDLLFDVEEVVAAPQFPGSFVGPAADANVNLFLGEAPGAQRNNGRKYQNEDQNFFLH